jgi:hypothetical protein
MTDCDRDCILMWDEVSLKEFLKYNKSKDERRSFSLTTAIVSATVACFS